ncbi:MAG: hypothetical protein K5842_00145 [Bacteroidales bacterium]|nr:hypothetical protein [Bacteroidales bacterium]
MEDNYSSNHAFTQSRISDELRFMTDGFADWVDRREHQRQRATRTLIGVAAVVAVIAIAATPDPDGHYVSSAQARTATINTIEQTTLIAKL